MANANHMQLEELNIMSHIHIPDGVAGNIWWLLVLGYAVVSLFLIVIFRKIDREEAGKKVPLVGIMSAIMLIAMSVPLGFIPFHINLASLCGIIVGPKLGFIAVFVVNLILAFIGHGGITVAGLNTLIVGVEVFLGSKLYTKFAREGKEGISSAISTFLALMVSTVITFIVIILITGGSPGMMLFDHHDHGGHGVEVTNILGEGSWLVLSIILVVGIALESVVTGLIVSFLSKVKPELVEPSRGNKEKW